MHIVNKTFILLWSLRTLRLIFNLVTFAFFHDTVFGIYFAPWVKNVTFFLSAISSRRCYLFMRLIISLCKTNNICLIKKNRSFVYISYFFHWKNERILNWSVIVKFLWSILAKSGPLFTCSVCLCEASVLYDCAAADNGRPQPQRLMATRKFPAAFE